MDELEQIYNLYIQGYSLRNLAKRFNIPKSTVDFRLKKRYGKDCASLRNPEGTLAIIKEYLRSPDLRQRDKIEINRWLNTNLTKLIEFDTQNREPLYSDAKLDKLTREQCYHGSKDWKDLFTVLNFN